MDPLTLWTAAGVAVSILAQFGQYVHLTNKIERRFTALEKDVEYLSRDVNRLTPKREGD